MMREYTDTMAHLDSQYIYFLSAAACILLIIFNDCMKATIAFAIVLALTFILLTYYYRRKGSRKVQYTPNPDPNKFYDNSGMMIGSRVVAIVMFVVALHLLTSDGDDSRSIAVIVLAIDIVLSAIAYLVIEKKISSRTSSDDAQ